SSDVCSSDLIGDVEMDPRPHFDSRTARLRENLNTTISAVAIIEKFRPHDDLMQKEIRARVGPPTGIPTDATIRSALEAMKAVKAERPDIDFEMLVSRVRVIHNPHTRVPLSRAVFNGPHDLQFLPNLTSAKI